MREALASYIEATYHLSNPKVVELRRRLLTEGGIAQTPFVESTPAYVGERKFASLALDEQIRDFLTSLATKEGEQLLFDPPYEHQAQALEATMARQGRWHRYRRHHWHRLGQDRKLFAARVGEACR